MTRLICSVLAFLSTLHLSVLTSSYADPLKPSSKSSQSRRRPVSADRARDKQPEVTHEQTYFAALFIKYAQEPAPKTVGQVLNTMDKFVPKDTMTALRAKNTNPETTSMPKFSWQNKPTMKLVFQENLSVFTADIFEKDPKYYMQVNGQKITHMDILNGQPGVDALFSATQKKEAKFSPLDMLIPQADAFMWPLMVGIGLVVIGIAIWQGLKSLANSRHKVEATVSGVPTNIKIDIPQEYRVMTASRVDLNASANLSGSATGTGNININTNGLNTLSGTISSIGTNVGNSINNAINSITNTINGRTGGTQ